MWLDEGVIEDSSLKLLHAKPKLYPLNICSLILTGMSVENTKEDPTPMIYGGNKLSLPLVPVSMLRSPVTCLLPKTKAIRTKIEEIPSLGRY